MIHNDWKGVVYLCEHVYLWLGDTEECFCGPDDRCPQKIMSLRRVSTIPITLLTYLLVLQFLFKCDWFARRVNSWLSGKAAAAVVSGCSSIGSVRESIEDGSYDIWEVVPH